MVVPVDRYKVEIWLRYLKQYNQFYRDVRIDDARLGNLAPGSVHLTLRTLEHDNEGEAPADEADLHQLLSENVYFTGVLEAAGTTGQLLFDRIAAAVVDLGEGDQPINEDIMGIFSLAFPYIFYDGNCDLFTPARRIPSLYHFVRHLLRQYIPRVHENHVFLYYCMNTVLNRRARGLGQVYVDHHPDTRSLTLEDLQAMVRDRDYGLLHSCFNFCSKLPATNSFWFAQRCRLLNMVEKLGPPTMFVTLSAADSFWPHLGRVVESVGGPPVPTRSADRHNHRRMLLNRYPALAADVFFQRAMAMLNHVIVPLFGFVDTFVRVEFQHRGSPHLHIVGWMAGVPPDIESLLGQLLRDLNCSMLTLTDLEVCKDRSPVGAAAYDFLRKVNGRIATAVSPHGVSGGADIPRSTTVGESGLLDDFDIDNDHVHFAPIFFQKNLSSHLFFALFSPLSSSLPLSLFLSLSST